MNINATIFGQILWFALFVWFVMKFVWPFLNQAIEQRQQTIADGLAAAERGRQEMEAAAKKSSDAMAESRTQAAQLLAQGEKRAAEIVEEAKQLARAEGERLVAGAKAEIDHEIASAREQLREQVAQLALTGAQQILKREVDASAHADLLDALKKQL